MRKTYGAGYPDTLPALLTWSERNASAPAVTDAAATLTWRALQDRVLRVAGGLRKAGIGAGSVVAERHRLSGCYLRLRSTWRAGRAYQYALSSS